MTRTRSPLVRLKNNVTCKPFREFVQTALLDRLQTGVISVVGKVGVVHPTFLVMPLTIEPTKARLCYDARYLNLWMKDQPFKLDQLPDVPRYDTKDTYQAALDDKLGYRHILLNDESSTFFRFEWGGWYITCNTLPFAWKILPYIYHIKDFSPVIIVLTLVLLANVFLSPLWFQRRGCLPES